MLFAFVAPVFFENDLQHNVSDLSMNLNGIIDAAVMGGITKYREAFFDGGGELHRTH